MSWWTISGEALLAALRQVEAGDSADVVYLELEANSTRDESGTDATMTMNQQDKQAFQQNWQQIKPQLQAQFPDLDESDLAAGQSDPDQLAQRIATKTGQDQAQVSQQISQLVSQVRKA